MAKVVAAAPKKERQVEVEFNFGASLDEAKKIFGEPVVYALFLAKAEIVIQDTVRRLINADKTDDEITAFIANFKLGVPTKRTGGPRKSTQEKLFEAISSGTMSKEDAKALIAKLTAAIK